MVGLRSLDRKVLRDLWHLRGQVLAIALVIGSGVATLVLFLSTQHGLTLTADTYNERYAFGDVFAGLKRAPASLAGRIADLPGVQTVQTRIVHFATLVMPGFDEPVTAKIVSVPGHGQPVLNQLVLRTGRWVDPKRPEEVLVNEPFAEAHGLGQGDEFVALLNGKRRTVRVAGVVLSPEYVYSLAPGALMGDDLRFGVLWMGRGALEAAFDLQGAFNDVSLRLSLGTNVDDVLPEVDRLLEPFGGVGSIGRADQISNWFVRNEIAQQGTMARILPTMFLLVSALLTNALLGRLIATERTQIGLMKAFGYSVVEVGWHYTKMVLAIAAVGILLGSCVGVWAGRVNLELYADSFRFPLLVYRPSLAAFVIAGGLSVAAALLATLHTVRRAALLPPAQAMTPPRPPTFQRGRLERTRVARWLDQPTRIILRQIARSPLRSVLTAAGGACGIGLLVMSLQWFDAIDYMATSFFSDAQRQDITVGLNSARPSTVLQEFSRMPSVMAVEPMRYVSADLRFGPVTHRGALTGVPSNAKLQPIFDNRTGTTVEVPTEGLVLATRLAEKLGVDIGDRVEVEVLEGRRPRVRLPVTKLTETFIGTPAYLHLDGLNRLLREDSTLQYVNLLVDPHAAPDLFRELTEVPEVSTVMLRQASVDSFHDTIADNLLVSVTMFSAFACFLAFGVAYNAGRISLSERGRDLATLRVLGFTRGEVAYILLGEVTLLVLLGLPFGCLLGFGLTVLLGRAFDTELFRMPVVIEPSTYGFAALISIAATLASAAILGRRLTRLNMIEVLKTRE